MLRDAHVSFGIDYAEYSTFTGAVRKSFKKVTKIATFYWGPFWVLALAAFPESVRERRFRVVLSSLVLYLIGILLTVGFQAHYAAPCASVFILLLVDAFRRVCRQWRSLGTMLVIASPPAWIAAQALSMHNTHLPNSLDQRPAVQARIASEPGRHIIFIHYGPFHPLGQEWVYNEPDIDHSQIIWARDFAQELNRELIRYYPTRKLWVVEPDHPVPRVSPCSPDCIIPEEGPASLTKISGH